MEFKIITPYADNEEYYIYTCNKCPLNIEIISLNELNNLITFKCINHGTQSMRINEYLSEMKKTIDLYYKCTICKKIQNEEKNNEIFKYCINCNLVFCNKCISVHDKDHLVIKCFDIYTKCKLHPNNNNELFCHDCNCHICKECQKQRTHFQHKKSTFAEIEPTPAELNIFSKIISNYKEILKNFEVSKNLKKSEKENEKK